MHCLFRLLVLLFSLLAATGCADRTAGGPAAPGPATLRVGITTNARPMAFREAGRVSGLEADLARGLARSMGREVRFVELSWQEQIPALTSGRIDIVMSSMSMTRQRSMLLDFTDPYMVTGQIGLVRLNEYNRFSNGFTDLLRPAIRIGTVRGTTGDTFIVRNIARVRPIRFRGVEQGVRGLLDNKIDVFVYDLPMNLYYGALYGDRGLKPVLVPMTREKLAWGVRHGDRALLEQANSYLARIRQSGDLQKMIEHWIPFYRNLHDAR
ncbi:MAG TPA: transporter substrate-binding domain-containing protein [Desulfobulbus sp.]|nr:transporter substrate-binding domain-containing protein [Desulfobulbus sp.]